ncbi:MAG: hypothetical protein M3Z20_07980 [Chloroflexota bacterium]|nr:hypothetical protein [Chloroflexota bacterium]
METQTNHDAEIEARVSMVAARAHRPLTSAEVALVRERIKRDLENREAMRALPLANSDAPDSGFNPRISVAGGSTW